MNKLEAIVRASNSKDVHKLNPHLFGVSASEILEHEVLEKQHPAKQKKRIRQSPKPLMNRLEAEWFEHIKHLGAHPQAVKLKLANSTFYKPDFFSFRVMTAWEVKGLYGKNADRGKLALKVAASAWPEIRFYLVWKEDGKWLSQEVLP